MAAFTAGTAVLHLWQLQMAGQYRIAGPADEILKITIILSQSLSRQPCCRPQPRRSA